MQYRIYFFLWILFGISLNAGAAVPNVVVTIKPIHSLVAGVMAGVKMPTLLMSGERSPHTQPLAPTEVRQIQNAKVIIWVGPAYEAPLRRVIESVKGCQCVITLLNKPGMKLYPMRQGGLWGNPDNFHEHDDDHHHHHDLSMDGHVWLDPDNAKAIVKIVAKELGALDPQHKMVYAANSRKVIKRLEELDRKLEKMLTPVKDKPYVVYHDGTQYFDRHFKTKAIGALLGDSHYGINAQHFLQISDYIRRQNVACVFTEPQFPTDKIHSLMDKTGTRIETLDYLGVGLIADQDAYFLMMRNLAKAFLRGLRGF